MPETHFCPNCNEPEVGEDTIGGRPAYRCGGCGWSVVSSDDDSDGAEFDRYVRERHSIDARAFTGESERAALLAESFNGRR